ncbi:MAG TPA: hypothetical protein VFT95_14345 [Micromonosporaceae bacterium]|nr:hypothetical protein [Micromonosporaceae bacterium]
MEAMTTTSRVLSRSTWRSRLTRTAAAAVGVLTLAGVALVGTTAPAAADPAAGAGADERRACTVDQLLFNRSFEVPFVTANGGAWQLFPNGSPWLGWRSLDGNVELWRSLGMPHTGRQHAEINANAEHNIIWQEFRTVPRTWLRWSVALKARNVGPGLDRENIIVRINGQVVDVVTVGENRWRIAAGAYQVPRGAWTSRFSLQVGRHGGGAGYGGLADTASVRGVRCTF